MSEFGKLVDLFAGAGYRLPSTDTVLASGKVTAYAAGTLTDKTVWTDRAKTTPAAQPFILGSDGRAEVYGDGVYDFVITTSADVAVETIEDAEYTQGLSASNQDSVGTIQELRDYSGVSTVVYILGTSTTNDSGAGTFVLDSSDLSAQVTADSGGEIYIAPTSDLTGASGAWVRQLEEVEGRIKTTYTGNLQFLPANALVVGIEIETGWFDSVETRASGAIWEIIATGQTPPDAAAGVNSDGYYYSAASSAVQFKNISPQHYATQYGVVVGFTNQTTLVNASLALNSDVIVPSVSGTYYFNATVSGSKQLRGEGSRKTQIMNYGAGFAITLAGNNAYASNFNITSNTTGHSYNTGVAYVAGDTTLNSGTYYQCNNPTTGAFNASDWNDIGTDADFGGVFIDGYNQACGHSQLRDIFASGGAGYGVCVVSAQTTPVVQWLNLQNVRFTQTGHAAFRMEGNCLEIKGSNLHFSSGGALGATTALTDIGGTRVISPSWNYRKGNVEFLCFASAADTFAGGSAPQRVFIDDMTFHGDLDTMQDADSTVRTAAMYISGLGQAQIAGSSENPFPSIFFARDGAEADTQSTCAAINFAVGFQIIGGNLPTAGTPATRRTIVYNTGGFFGVTFKGSRFIEQGALVDLDAVLLHDPVDADVITGDVSVDDAEMVVNSTSLSSAADIVGNMVGFVNDTSGAIYGFAESVSEGTGFYANKIGVHTIIRKNLGTDTIDAISRRRGTFRGVFANGDIIKVSTVEGSNTGAPSTLTLVHSTAEATMQDGKMILAGAVNATLSDGNYILLRFNDYTLTWDEYFRNF